GGRGAACPGGTSGARKGPGGARHAHLLALAPPHAPPRAAHIPIAWSMCIRAAPSGLVSNCGQLHSSARAQASQQPPQDRDFPPIEAWRQWPLAVRGENLAICGGAGTCRLVMVPALPAYLHHLAILLLWLIFVSH